MCIKTGFIGLGIMGKPMALNLLSAGVDLMVYDKDPAAVEALTAAGAVAGDRRSIGAACERIFLILPNGDIVKDVLFGEGGVAETLLPGVVVCDMSSVTPVESRYCYENLKAPGRRFCRCAGIGRRTGSNSWNAGLHGRR